MHYAPNELLNMGVKFGKNVIIDKTVRIINPANLTIDDNTRIDCFSLISCGEKGIFIGNNCHIAAGVYLYGGGDRIILEEFVGISSHVSVYTANDDYVNGWLTGPTVPDTLRNIKTGPILLKKHSLIGAGSVVLPGVSVGVGGVIGAISLAKRNVENFEITGGNPLRHIGFRDKTILTLEKILDKFD